MFQASDLHSDTKIIKLPLLPASNFLFIDS
jgi:hypothetical protein